MRNDSKVVNSGNSDVDVSVIVDTSALAYAISCYLHAKHMLNNDEFVQMMTNLNLLLGKTHDELPDLVTNKIESKTIFTPNDTQTVKKFLK
ncbi:hypothetical protein [Metabacillus iocasae]|uniref:PIN domain-containing protein n=1 Tax=Priestia iocasae TaxID=2291674 RepID=A0ABS2QWK4_9BACI|nr:hypothetical protein [Metabacillus iocasae]MBM7703844.1 hypothetical protein [Metabacillus iocasae]